MKLEVQLITDYTENRWSQALINNAKQNEGSGIKDIV